MAKAAIWSRSGWAFLAFVAPSPDRPSGRLGGRFVSTRVSSFRWLPHSAPTPIPNLSRLRLTMPPPSKKRFAGEGLR
jgi:hypothetical protein